MQASAAKKGVQILLPTDVVIADKFAADANTKIVSVDNIPDGWMGLDIGPDSVKAFQAELATCKLTNHFSFHCHIIVYSRRSWQLTTRMFSTGVCTRSLPCAAKEALLFLCACIGTA